MPAATGQKVTENELTIMKSIMDGLTEFKDDEGNTLSEVFMEIISRRELPDYWRIIKAPIAIVTVQNKIKRKMYHNFQEFINDCARIFHNAKTYNRPSSQIYKDAVTLEGVFLRELKTLSSSETPVITADEAILPDLGPLPPASPSVSGDSEREADTKPNADVNGDGEGSAAEASAKDSGEDEEEEEDEDEEMADADVAEEGEDDDSDQAGRRRTRRRVSTKKAEETADTSEDKAAKTGFIDTRKKRGRPPRVDTPMESRIKAVLKGIRKYRDSEGEPKFQAFDKLPDIKMFPEYYRAVPLPIAIDNIKKRVKRREYTSVDMFVDDMNLMFDNAMMYNEDGSKIFQDAQFLKLESQKLAEIEKAKDDSEYQDDTSKHFSKTPLTEIFHNGTIYKVGDWVHIRNPNDPSKPTVGQIFRTWRAPDTKIWINACWYYRPEQTVHRHNKRFYENEVAKTGQYRDHEIDEVLDKCFVMFYTKASRGRPKACGDKTIYICEARYNEVDKHFNKIKTWKSCIPDEVRNQDYEMDYFEKPNPLKKYPSPLKDTLPANATEDDDLPNATMGHPNAPPKIGAVFLRQRGPNDSPSPEPTPPPRTEPSPPPTAPTPSVAPVRVSTTRRNTEVLEDKPRYSHSQPQATPASYSQSQTLYQTPTYEPNNVKATSYAPPTPAYNYQQPTHYRQNTSYNQNINIPVNAGYENGEYEPAGPPTTFVFPDVEFPPEILAKHQCNDQGQMLFFNVPPMNIAPAPFTFWGISDGSGATFPPPKQHKARRCALQTLKDQRHKRTSSSQDEALHVAKKHKSEEDDANGGKTVHRNDEQAMIHWLTEYWLEKNEELDQNAVET